MPTDQKSASSGDSGLPQAQRRFNVFRYISRNIMRNRKRSVLTVISITICVAFFILFAALAQGINDYIIETTAAAKTGFIIVTRPAGTDVMTAHEAEIIGDAFAHQVSALGRTGEWYPFMKLPLLRDETDGFKSKDYPLIAYDPARGLRLPGVKIDEGPALALGADFTDASANEVILGYNTWNRFFSRQTPGAFLSIGIKNLPLWRFRDPTRQSSTQSQPPTESSVGINIVSGLGRVRLVGVLERTGTETDNGVYVPLDFLLQYIGYHDPGQDTFFYEYLALVIHDARGLDFNSLKEWLKSDVGETDTDILIDGYDNSLAVKSAAIGAKNLKQIIDAWLLVIIGIIIIITMINVSNTMLMTVSERTREIGTLRAVGIHTPGIYTIILGESSFLCVLGFTLGTLIGGVVAVCIDALYRWSSISSSQLQMFVSPASVTVPIIILAALLSVGIGCIAALYPSYRASKLEPIEAIRYE